MTARELIKLLNKIDEKDKDKPISYACHECGKEGDIEGIENKSKHLRIY